MHDRNDHFVIGSWYISASLFVVRNEEKLIFLPVYSSFKGGAAGSLWTISVATSSGSRVK